MFEYSLGCLKRLFLEPPLKPTFDLALSNKNLGENSKYYLQYFFENLKPVSIVWILQKIVKRSLILTQKSKKRKIDYLKFCIISFSNNFENYKQARTLCPDHKHLSHIVCENKNNNNTKFTNKSSHHLPATIKYKWKNLRHYYHCLEP